MDMCGVQKYIECYDLVTENTIFPMWSIYRDNRLPDMANFLIWRMFTRLNTPTLQHRCLDFSTVLVEGVKICNN